MMLCAAPPLVGGSVMRALAITLSLLGPLVTFLLGAIVTAFAILGSPFTINTPGGYLATALAAAPGVAMSGVAAGTGLRSASQNQRRGWLVAQGVWLAAVIVATVVIAIWFNSNDLPWFFPLIALPLLSLLYWIFNR
jgi:hypothetical protein